MGISVCYMDETGCPGKLPAANSSIQPVFVLSALFVDEAQIRLMTTEFVKLKVKYYPAKFSHLSHDLEAMRVEIKGSDLKKELRGAKGLRAKATAERFLDGLISLVNKVDGKLVSRIWIKGVGTQFNGRSVYAKTIQKFGLSFQLHLNQTQNQGLIIADFREPRVNSTISHAIFSQKFKRGKKGDAYPSIIESPLFGVSDNHAGLQIVDVISSALICPMATYVYCTGHVNNVHVNADDQKILSRYKKRIRGIEFKYFSSTKKHFGISVQDMHAGKPIQDMFA